MNLQVTEKTKLESLKLYSSNFVEMYNTWGKATHATQLGPKICRTQKFLKKEVFGQ